MGLEQHGLVVKQMARHKVEPRVAAEDSVRSAYREAAAGTAPTAAAPRLRQRLRTVGCLITLGCGLSLNLPNLAHGSQMTLEMLKALEGLI
jgi:hypothetical protein